MTVEVASFIDQLNPSLPLLNDPVAEGDDHIRLLKTTLIASFVNATYPLDFNVIGVWGGISGTLGAQTDLQAALNAKVDDGQVLTNVPGGAIFTDANAVWGNVTGTLASQTDLQTLLDLKAPLAAPAFAGNVSVAGRLDLETYSEDADSFSITTGTKDLDLSGATYFYAAAAMTDVAYTFTFSNPPVTGRVIGFTVELNNASVATTTPITWPASVNWGDAGEPIWTAGIDIVSFVSRDNGTIYRGFQGGLNF